MQEGAANYTRNVHILAHLPLDYPFDNRRIMLWRGLKDFVIEESKAKLP